MGLAAQSGTVALAASIMALFSIGAATPVLALAYGSRQAVASRKNSLAKVSRVAKPLMGVVLVAIGVLTVSGADRALEGYLTAAMPLWLLDLTTRF